MQLPEDVLRHGSVDSFSAFAFESYLERLKWQDVSHVFDFPISSKAVGTCSAKLSEHTFEITKKEYLLIYKKVNSSGIIVNTTGGYI
ncbi:unnamed protein product [Dibothriocephalus latus]|uniref:Uncharacterized protein n=1 Tax=Dibothriocephalus latus TaxID=60516 RepID=A0A3P7MA19_DIBLA|nr:unnamed protein product [Dibothriocephalus latus]